MGGEVDCGNTEEEVQGFPPPGRAAVPRRPLAGNEGGRKIAFVR